MKFFPLIKKGAMLVLATFVLLSCNEQTTTEETAYGTPAPNLEEVSVSPLSPKEQDALDEFESWLDTSFVEFGPPGLAVAVLKGNEVVMEKTFGVLDVETQQSVQPNSVFRLASVSKGFAPVLTGILVQEGCLHWDDLVAAYLPDFALNDPAATKQLSLRHVLSHTTGLPRHTYSNLLNMNVPYQEILPVLKEVELSHPVGTWYNYQNVAYSLIGDVIEQATGMSYGEALAERIFQILGMEGASTSHGAIAGCQNTAMPHGPDAEGYHRIALRDKFYSVGPAAGVNANLEDMEEWLRLLMGYRPDVIDSTALQALFQPQADVAPIEGVMRAWRPMDVSAYGMGWRLVEKDQKHYVFHGGFVNGYRSEIGFCQEQGLGIVLLSNGSSRFVGDALPHFFSLQRKGGA